MRYWNNDSYQNLFDADHRDDRLAELVTVEYAEKRNKELSDSENY